MADRTEREKLVEEALAAIERAMDMVDALCRPRGSVGSREWLMSIPARPEHDPDLVISDALGKAKKALAAADLLSEEGEPVGWQVEYRDTGGTWWGNRVEYSRGDALEEVFLRETDHRGQSTGRIRPLYPGPVQEASGER